MARAGRKRKLKSITLAIVGRPTPTTFDLREDYIGGQPKDSGTVEVDNPHDPGQKILVFRKLRDDPLGRMHDRGHIDEASYRAGRHWQRLYETAEIAGAQAIDPSKDVVDGGQISHSAISDQQAEAFAKLALASRAVGMVGESILRDVLANRMFPEEVARARGFANQRGTDYYARRFRECLDTLTEVFGFATARRGL